MAWGRLLGLYGTVVPECFLREGSEGDFDDITLVGGDIHQQPAGVGAGEIPQGGEKQAYLLRRDAAVRGISSDGGDGDAGGNPAVKQAAGQPQPERFFLGADDDLHGLLHKYFNSIAVGAFHLHQLADHTLLHQLENLLDIDAFHGLRSAASGHLRHLHSHLQSHLHQRHGQIDPYLIAGLGIDDDPEDHILDGLALLLGQQGGFRLALVAQELIGGDAEEPGQLRQQGDIGAGETRFP